MERSNAVRGALFSGRDFIVMKGLEKIEEIAEIAGTWIGSTVSIVVHTVAFVAIFVTYFFGVSFSTILLVLTTLVSLEAIYLSIFIQMTVNKQSHKLKEHSRHLGNIHAHLKGEQDHGME